MTRQERVKRYMEILDQYDEGNSSYNWSILDTLSDDDLYNEEKIAEKINIIQKHESTTPDEEHYYQDFSLSCAYME